MALLRHFAEFVNNVSYRKFRYAFVLEYTHNYDDVSVPGVDTCLRHCVTYALTGEYTLFHCFVAGVEKQYRYFQVRGATLLEVCGSRIIFAASKSAIPGCIPQRFRGIFSTYLYF